jgi:hypothetical protein
MSFTPSSIAEKILKRRLADEERRRKEQERSLVNSQLRKASLEYKENEFRKNLSEDSLFFEFTGRDILVAGLEKWESVLFIDDGTVDAVSLRRAGFDVYKTVATNSEQLKHAFPDSLICFDELRLTRENEFYELHRIRSRLANLFESYFPIKWKLSRNAREIIDLLDLEIPSKDDAFKDVKSSLKKIYLATRSDITRFQSGEQIPEIVEVLSKLKEIFEENAVQVPVLEINWSNENSKYSAGDQTVDKAFCFFNADFLRWISTGNGNQFFIELFSHVEHAVETGSTELALSFPRQGKNNWHDFSGEFIPYPPSSIIGFLHFLEYEVSLKKQRDHFLMHIEWCELDDLE